MCDTEIFYGLNFFLFFGGVSGFTCTLFCLFSEHDIESRREQACQATELCLQ